ncbi:unnamed protein product, partial [Effrenium voratum]
RLPARAKVARQAAEATPASITISKKMSELDERVKAVEKPEEEMFWRVLAYCTACRTPWCKLPWRRHTCLKGDAKAEGAQGNRCDMSWEDYTDILTRSVPLISHKKAQILTRECWREGDADPSGIGVVTVCIVPKVAAEATLSRPGYVHVPMRGAWRWRRPCASDGDALAVAARQAVHQVNCIFTDVIFVL